MDEVIPSDHKRREASVVIQWYGLIHDNNVDIKVIQRDYIASHRITNDFCESVGRK